MQHSHTQCKRGSAVGLSGNLSFLFLLAWAPVNMYRRKVRVETETERERERDRERETTTGPWSLFCLFLCLWQRSFFLCLPCPYPSPWLPQDCRCCRMHLACPPEPQQRKHEQPCWLAPWILRKSCCRSPSCGHLGFIRFRACRTRVEGLGFRVFGRSQCCGFACKQLGFAEVYMCSRASNTRGFSRVCKEA